MACSCNAGEGCMCMYEDMPGTRIIPAEVTDEMVERAVTALDAGPFAAARISRDSMAEWVRVALVAAFQDNQTQGGADER